MTSGAYEWAERFWSKADTTGDACWLWRGCKTRLGYGMFKIGGRAGKSRAAHRLAWELTHGPIAQGGGFHGTCVLHRCDNPACVRPSHLFLGTHADNMRDMASKKRFRIPRLHGEAIGSARLKVADVESIRQRYATGAVSQRELAEAFGVSQSAVSLILAGKTWRAA
jgi:hypothetical protein